MDRARSSLSRLRERYPEMERFVSAAGADSRALAPHSLREWRRRCGRLVREHYNAVADLDLGVPDLAVWRGKTHHLGRAEGFFIEVERASSVAHDEIRRDACVTGGNRLDHGTSPQ